MQIRSFPTSVAKVLAIVGVCRDGSAARIAALAAISAFLICGTTPKAYITDHRLGHTPEGSEKIELSNSQHACARDV
ncbi:MULTISPECIES: hypothetical protein [Burkholderia]|uniref:hypothetical protein n=1 Tax=Burkholderia TaxID=32008 RepID=UPI000F59DA73|nr:MULTISPECIES: hypothetical protein [Burkholderia cepacia complex]MBR8158476.1 hypothetical protein [Burkholderia cenocepacia]MDF3079841.1 hypothetical protein [Burkholderia sola]MDF3100064.1 hypothetical protein [Burkholderia semiarida]MDF3104553.1 hypothetical protein [Burkholderia semiarida]MDN7485601.1 hypothetical protein [Burkholderia orbicola]